MIYLLILSGLFSAISDASNHGKINYLGTWFKQEAWTIKYSLFYWLETILPKPIAYVMAYWVLIYFTDAFHFFKGMFIITVGFCIQDFSIQWYYSFLIYSASFTVFYTALDLINKRTI